MQSKYWNLMVHTKFREIYIDELVKKYQRKESRVKIISIIFSLGTVISLSTQLGFASLITVITAFIQVYLIIEDYLPHKKNQKELIRLKEILSKKFIEISHDWYYVSNSQWTEDEINQKCTDFEMTLLRETQQITNSVNFDDNNKKLIELAQIKTDQYFSSSIN
ncbi:hypothetical protein [Turicibacter sanguinis]|uniref:hypothetical protein n=1 Tax=Turicibacter sanguinis TaxID=154288 RepID=UPI001053E198|nr:hypothetical protein [Turicibacter sanguinis]QJS19223.1 hypothetical protein HLK68_08105 [Turicibacter sanguinis]